MNIDPWILAFSAVTVIATVWMGFRSAKTSKTASDFFVAGRSVSVGWNASAISGEYLSAASFMGVAGMVMSSGYDALWYPVCYACGYLFLLLFIAGPLRRFGAYTIPDFAEGRFDSPVFRKIAVVFVLFIGFFYTMPQMKGAGTTLAYIFPGLPYWAGVVLVGAVITLNVALGGMKGITLVQAVQYWIKMFAISVPIFVLMAVYGSYGKQISVNGPEGPHAPAALSVSANPSLEEKQRFDAINAAEQWSTFSERKPLPAQAPPDSTWLNPFGPLTTKAAKAAAARKSELDWSKRSHLSDPLPFVQQKPNLVRDLDQFTERFDRKSPPKGPVKYETGAAGKPLWEISMVLKHWANLADILCDTNLLLRTIVWNSTAPQSPQELVSALEQELNKQGVGVIHAGEREWWVVPLADMKSYFTPLDTRPYALLYTYSLIIALVCGTAGLPHILVRFYTNPDGVAAKRTTMWVMILIGVFYVFPPVFGVMGRNLLPSLYEGVGAKGTDKVVLELPRILNEQVGRWAGERVGDATNAAALPPAHSPTRSLSASPEAGASKGIPWGSILSGITCAGAFAAFMSTFSGLLVSMTGAMAHDVYGRMLNPKATPQQRLRAFKIAAVIIGGVAILLGMQVEPLQINFMVGQAFAIAAASYFPLLFMSAWWRGMTTKGAAVGMLTGGLLALIGISLTSFSDLSIAGGATAKLFSAFKPLNDFWAVHPLLRILCEQPAIWTVPLAIALMVIVSKLTRREIPEDIRMKMLVLHAPEKLGLKQEYIQEHHHGH